MSNIIEIPKKLPSLPAALRATIEEANASLEIPGGGTYFPRISSNRRQFSIMENGVEPVIIRGDDGRPVDHLDVVILCANQGMHRSFYKAAYDSKAKEKDGPVCWSPNGIAPHPSAKEPQSKTCATCKNAVYGSKITEQGKKSFACSESKRLLVLPPDDLGGKIYMLNVSYSAHKALRSYLSYLKQNGVYSLMVETRLSFDEAWDVPVFSFSYIQLLDQAAVDTVAPRLDEPEVAAFIKGETDTETDAPRVMAEPDQETPTPAPAPAPTPAPTSKVASGGFGKGGKSAGKEPVQHHEEATEQPSGEQGDLSELLDF